MLIILEGADGSGKTTLANKLNDLYPVMRIDRDNERVYKLFHLLQLGIDFEHLDFVIDRSFITDIVYRSVFNDEEVNGNKSISLSEMAEVLNKSVIIYCKTNTSYADSQKRGEDNITNAKTHKKICDCYDKVMTFIKTRSDAKVITYDWRKMSFEKLVEELKDVGGTYGI